MKRVVLIGEAPGGKERSINHSPLYPYPYNSAGARLWRMTELSRGEYLRLFCRLNLIHVPVRGSWPWKQARYAACDLFSSGLFANSRVICLGNKVWEAFNGKPDKVWCTWYSTKGGAYPHEEFSIACIPHPSGRNLLYNREHAAQAVGAFLVAAQEEASIDVPFPT